MSTFLFAIFILGLHGQAQPLESIENRSANNEGILHNCYQGKLTSFFVNDLEEIRLKNNTAIFLLNNAQVIGVLDVRPQKDDIGNVKVVEVHGLFLCSSLQVDSFSYIEDDTSNLLYWLKKPKNSFTITQDEGMIVLDVGEIVKDEYATKVHLNFRAYDVFSKEANEKVEDFLPDWGAPKGKGDFYFYIPSSWIQ